MHSVARWTLAVVGLTLAFTASAAKDPNEKAIKARQAVMTLQSWYAGPLFQMAKGDMDYDAGSASVYAMALHTMVTVKGDMMWPPGTDSDAYPDKSRTLPELWSNWPVVGEKGQALLDASAALAEVAGDGLDALRSKVGAVGQACKGCHDDFRAD